MHVRFGYMITHNYCEDSMERVSSKITYIEESRYDGLIISPQYIYNWIIKLWDEYYEYGSHDDGYKSAADNYTTIFLGILMACIRGRINLQMGEYMRHVYFIRREIEDLLLNKN